VAAAADVTLWVLRWAKIEFALDIWDISFEFLLSLFLIFGLFDSVVVIAFQIAFRVKMHANNIFYFLKIIFNISTSK
jgi:hypothetical protein